MQKKVCEKLHSVIESSSYIFLSWELGSSWKINYISRNIEQFGYKQNELLLQDNEYLEMIYDEDRKRIVAEIETNKNSVEYINQRYRITNAEREKLHLVDAHTIFERDDKCGHVKCFSILKNVTETQTLADLTPNLPKELQNTNILTQALLYTNDMVRITDANGIIIFANDAFLQHTGYTLGESIGHTPNIIKSGEHDSPFYQKLWETIENGKGYSNVFKNKKKDGTIYYEAETLTPILDKTSNTRYYISVGKDISERIAIEKKLEYKANTDALTGVYNRQKFLDEIDIAIDKLKRYNNQFALLMIDVDNFKEINDNYGHNKGDQVLQKITQLISKEIRKSDIFARWGGEEFIIIAPGLDKKMEVVSLAEKIRKSVASFHFEDIGTITISLGMTLSKTKDSFENIFQRIDNALYYAKRHGRNKTHFL